MASGHHIGIISFGPSTSPILQNNPHFLRHVLFNGFDLLRARRLLADVLKSFKPDIIHFFDSSCYSVIPWLLNVKKFKLVLNKCGGPNLHSYPYAKNIIVFSYENYAWFLSNVKFAQANIALIPNRVNPIALDPARRPVEKPHNSFVFVRICRIGTEYRKSIEDSIRLLSLMHKRGNIHTQLFVIGAVENQSVFSHLLSLASPLKDSIHFLTNPHITKEASNMLYLADAVVGTGRGLMEAASLGIPLLAINSTDNYPVLIDHGNFFDAFKTNFSQRNLFHNYNHDHNIDKISMLLNDKSYWHKLSHHSSQVFEQYFDVKSSLSKYTSFYNQASIGSNCFRNIQLSSKDFCRFAIYSPLLSSRSFD
jgi:glycosyltransferase involved in cell wall biosynthesis